MLGTVDDLATAWHERALAAVDSPEPLWLALGDSLSQGVGTSSIDRSFVGRVADRLALSGRPHGVVNIARSGARIRDVIEHQLPLIERLPRAPALISVTAGSNDLLRSARFDRAVTDLGQLIGALPRTTIVAALPDGGSLMARRLNTHIRRLATEHGMRVADVPTHLTTWRGRAAADGFHPNELGYQAWVDAFSAALDLPIGDGDAAPER